MNVADPYGIWLRVNIDLLFGNLLSVGLNY